jgi:polysaccharide export outer membrane protein
LTTPEFTELLNKEYSNHLVNLNITVIVREYAGLKVYVGGEVRKPTFLTLKGHMTILQSVFAANGFKNTANTETVLLVRKGPENKPVSMVIDLGAVISGEELQNDIYLRPSDIVFVPKTWVAKANVFVDQYVRGLFFFDSVMQGVGYALGYELVRDINY